MSTGVNESWSNDHWSVMQLGKIGLEQICGWPPILSVTNNCFRKGRSAGCWGSIIPGQAGLLIRRISTITQFETWEIHYQSAPSYLSVCHQASIHNHQSSPHTASSHITVHKGFLISIVRQFRVKYYV